jgi:hypothetical protein
MIAIDKIKEFLSKTEKTEGDTVHDLVCKEIRKEPYFEDVHLKNVSDTDNELVADTPEAVPSPVYENIAFAEERLTTLLEESEIKARATVNANEEPDCAARTSWTSVFDGDEFE